MTETSNPYFIKSPDQWNLTPEVAQIIADGAISSDKIAENPHIPQDYKDLIADPFDPLLELNLKIAAIAGWENIQEWNPNPKADKRRKVFQGTNKKHPELGIFVPDYTSDLNAITKVFKDLGIYYRVSFDPPLPYPAYAFSFTNHEVLAETEAIALCKLLLELAPNLPKSEPEVQVIDDDDKY